MNFLIFLLLLTACCPKSYEEVLLGKVEKGRYYDPQGFFSIGIPYEEVWRIGESGAPADYSGVIFYNSPENLQRVEAVKIPDPDFIHLAMGTSKEERSEMLQVLFHEKIVPLITKNELQAEVLYIDLVPLEEEQGYFVLLRLGNGEFCFIEGFLSCFICDQYVIFSSRSPCTKEEHLQRLLAFYSSFRNECLSAEGQSSS